MQFWLILGAALWLQKADADLPRAHAEKIAWSRLGLTALSAAVIAWRWPACSPVAKALLVYSVVSAVVLSVERVVRRAPRVASEVA